MLPKINTLQIESDLAVKYGYRPLPKSVSKKYHEIYLANIPVFLKLGGDDIVLCSLGGTIIANGYERTVIGDYGAFIEFNESQANTDAYIVPPKQMFRINNPAFADKVKYEWYSIEDGSNIKIYKQKRPVKYADYKPGMYYVSVHEVSPQKG